MQRFATGVSPARTMTDAEAQEVLRRYLQRPEPAGVSFESLAEALQISEEEVEQLLADVRLNSTSDGEAKAMRRAKRRDIFLAIFALGFVIASAFAAWSFFRYRQMPSGIVTPSFKPAIAVPAPIETGVFSTEWAEETPASYQFTLGFESRVIEARVAPLNAAANANLLEILAQDVETSLISQRHYSNFVEWTPPQDASKVSFELTSGPVTVSCLLPNGSEETYRIERRKLLADALGKLQRRARLWAEGFSSGETTPSLPGAPAPPPLGVHR